MSDEKPPFVGDGGICALTPLGDGLNKMAPMSAAQSPPPLGASAPMAVPSGKATVITGGSGANKRKGGKTEGRKGSDKKDVKLAEPRGAAAGTGTARVDRQLTVEMFGQITSALRRRWLRTPEVYRLLHTFRKHGVEVRTETVQRPASGSWFLYAANVKV